MPHELLRNDGSQLDPWLNRWIDSVIVPALVREYLAESRELKAEQTKMPERLNLISEPARAWELRPNILHETRLSTVAEDAVACSSPEA